MVSLSGKELQVAELGQDVFKMPTIWRKIFDRPQLEIGIKKNQTISYLPPNNLRLLSKLLPFQIFDFKLASV